MTWILTIVILLFLLLCWMLVSPLVLELDSSTSSAKFTWPGIGKACLWYDGQWRIVFHIFFFRKKLNLSEHKKQEDKPVKKIKQKTKSRVPFHRMVNCFRSFRIVEWKLAIDTGDYALNARLYPLNFLPRLRHHLDVNFAEKNYFYMKIRNYPWRMIYAFLR